MLHHEVKTHFLHILNALSTLRNISTVNILPTSRQYIDECRWAHSAYSQKKCVHQNNNKNGHAIKRLGYCDVIVIVVIL